MGGWYNYHCPNSKAIRKSLPTGVSDRFLEHALIYALIRIDDLQHTLPLLSDANPDVRRAGLIALDQMPHGKLTRSDVAPLLDTEDPSLQQAALETIARHDGWADEIVSLADAWLQSKQLSASQTRSLTGAIVAFADDLRIQQLVQDRLASTETPEASRLLLLRAMSRCRLTAFPPGWTDLVKSQLTGKVSATRGEAVNVIRFRNMVQFDAELKELASRNEVPIDQRVAAPVIVAARLRPLPGDMFSLLTSRFAGEVDPLSRLSAASALSQARLTDEQFSAVTKIIAREGPLTVPLPATSFQHCRNEQIGRALMCALDKSPGGSALDDVETLLKNFPPSVWQSARPLLDSRAERQRQDEEAIAHLFARVSVLPGEAARGRKVFFSKKVACYGCHQMENEGGRVGPDLTQIGRVRRTMDLAQIIHNPKRKRGGPRESSLTLRVAILRGVLGKIAASPFHIATCGDLSQSHE